MEKRYAWIDALRGFLIMTVVLGHSLQHGDCEHKLLWNIIYSFHMAAFFVVSGYVSYKTNVNLASAIKKRAIQLLLPYFSWSLITILLFKNANPQKIFDYIKYPDQTYWFVYVLFIISFICLILLHLSRKYNMKETPILIVGGVF